MRMVCPCRPATCMHLQCFDASLFLQMNERKPTWICPVCDKPALYDNLVVDGWLLSCFYFSSSNFHFTKMMSSILQLFPRCSQFDTAWNRLLRGATSQGRFLEPPRVQKRRRGAAACSRTKTKNRSNSWRFRWICKIRHTISWIIHLFHLSYRQIMFWPIAVFFKIDLIKIISFWLINNKFHKYSKTSLIKYKSQFIIIVIFTYFE